MAKYQTADEWLKTQRGASGGSGGQYQTAEEWLSKNARSINETHFAVKREANQLREEWASRKETPQDVEEKPSASRRYGQSTHSGRSGKFGGVQYPYQPKPALHSKPSTDFAQRREELQKSYQDALDEAIQANPGVGLHNLPLTDDMKLIREQMNELDAMEDSATYNKYQEMISSLSEKDRKALEDSHGRDTTMAYGYLLQSGYSREDINAMYETMQREKNADTSKQVIDAVYDYSGQNVGTGAVGFTGARAGNIVGGITGTFQAIHDTAQHYFQGSPYRTTDPNGLGYLPSRAAAAADQSISDAIEGENGGIVRKGAAFVYRGAANAADNLARMALASATGGGAVAGAGINSALSFTQGFQGSYREAQEKGGSPIQGFLVGAVDGGMEVFTESRTFERWMNLKDPELIGKGVYAWLKSAAVGIGNEITEEEASYIANTIADAVVMADKSENAEFIKSAVESGKTQAEARWELVKKYAHEMAVTAADTAMSTILMDGATGAVANYQYKRTYGGSAAELVQEGLESPEGTESRTLAEEYQKKLDSGKALSGGELRRLVNANEEQFSREEAEEEFHFEADNETKESVIDSEETDAVTEEEPKETVTLESLSEKYGAYSEAMRGNYLKGQDVEEYDRAFRIAYDMGKSGLNKAALSRVEALSSLNESQREIAYEIGEAAASAQAEAQSKKNSEAANGKTGWHKGVVRGDGVKIADLTKTFNDPQRKAYSTLSTIAEATGIDIVLYKSQADENGVFQGEQGRFKWSDNTIYIDVNAGLSTTKDVGSLAKYTMLRTYGHEFTHFIEKWNPEQYNDFRKAVFDTMENPEDLIETRLAQDSIGKMSYDDASREVVAEAMTDILEDSKFIQKLAEKHTSVFETLRSKLKEFIDNLKSYFKSLARNGSREARLLKQEVGDSISYLEDIVKRFDEAAVQAIENYQKTVAEDNTETESETKTSENETKDDSFQDSDAPIESKQAENDSIQEEGEKEEKKPEEKQEPETTSYGSFSITPNTERGTLEIRFDSKPSEKVRDVLKANKFRWSSKNKLWYGKADQNVISKRIADAMDSADNQSAPQNSSAEEKVQYQQREYEDQTFTLRDLDIDRYFIQYENVYERNNAENQTVNHLLQSGKVTIIDESVASSFIATTDWTKKSDARNCIRAILKKFVGKDIQFSYHGQTAVAYLTNRGIDHAVSGANTMGKALALDSFYEMIRNAEYSYSGKGDHGSVGGRVDWDYFVSVARIGETDIPMVFAIRTIDTDSRSQIYSIATKESPTILRGDGTQNQSANAHPSYEDSSGSGNRLAHSSGDVNNDYSQNQKRTETLTDREILSMAADRILSNEALSMDAAVSDSLDIFKKRLAALDSLQEQRRELGRAYKELQFGENVDREKAAETLKKMRELDGKIQEAENKVIAAETAPALRKVLPVARRIVEQKQKEQDDAVLQRWRDRRNNAAAIKKYRDRISKDVTDLSNWILSPSNKTDMKHVPDVLKNTVIEFINSINFTSKRQLNGGEATQADIAFMNRLVALQRALDKNAEDTGLYSGYNDLPPGFHDKLKAFIASAQAIVNAKSGKSVINQMTSQELKSLSEIVKALKKHIKDFNRFHANAVYQHVYDAGDATIRELNEYNDAKSRTKAGEGINNFVFWNQIRPAYAFERFGNGGKAIYDGLRRGQAQLAFDTKAIVSFSEKAYTEKEVTDWDKEVKTIQLEDGTVKMRVSQIMSFYELLKREQAKGHIFGQGIRVSTFLSDGKKVSDTGHTISIEDANRIIAELTPRQIAVADALQKYMQEKGGSWGNYVSVKRFGEKMFGEENYFPINSDGRHIEAVADDKMEGQSLYALLNMGFTKKLQEEANNRIVVYSIFDVFSNHMASMAQYHSFALPVLDALKWFNYQQKEPVTVMKNGKEHVQNQVVDSVRDQLDRVFGVPEETKPGAGRRGYAENFIVGILKAFNGTESHGISSDEIGMNSLRRFNMAQVAYNFRVVIQQPMAITRAAMVIDYSSIIRGLRLSPKAIQKNIEEMNQYSGIAAWKDLGFYDTNISRGLTDIIKHKKTGMEKFRETGMWGAEKADQLTWAAMWSACKEEVQRKRGIMPGSEHFYEAVSSLFEEVVYKTQVVDSVLTKNEYLRSKGLFARATGSFMSEPTTTASMLADAFDKYRMDLQKKGGNHRDAWRKNGKRIGRTLYVYSLGAVILAAVQAVADAFRDDDEYEEYGEKWMEAFIGNIIDELNPFNKLPLVTEFCDLAKNLLAAVGVDTYGYAPSSIWLQWADDLVKGTQILYQKIFGDGNNYTWYGGISKMLKAVSGMSGVPMAAVTREVITGWNSIIQYMAPDLVVRTYKQKPETEIKYTFLDGKMSYDKAVQALIQDAGYSYEDATKKVDALKFQRDNPKYSDASESSVQKYLEFGNPNKISPEVFFDVWSFESDAIADRDKNGKPIGGSKRDKVCDYINNQNLTKAQKDALYFVFGYSKETIKDTPWH